MTNEERNTALYKKLFAEQEVFRDGWKSRPPGRTLNLAFKTRSGRTFCCRWNTTTCQMPRLTP